MWQRTAVPCLVLAALLAATFADRPALAAEKEELTLAVIRTEEMSTLAKRWETAIEYLSKKLDVNINFYTTTSYASVVEAMLSGFVDVASLGPKIYIVAHEKSGGAIEPIVSYTIPADMFNEKPCGCYLGARVTKTGSTLKPLAVPERLTISIDLGLLL